MMETETAKSYNDLLNSLSAHGGRARPSGQGSAMCGRERDSAHPSLPWFLSRFKTRPCHPLLWHPPPPLLWHPPPPLFPGISQHSLGKAREAYMRWKSTEGRGYSTMYSTVWTQRRHQPFSNLEHKDSIGNSSLIPIRFKLESQRAEKSSWREAMAPRWQGGESADNWAKDSRKGRRGNATKSVRERDSVWFTQGKWAQFG